MGLWQNAAILGGLLIGYNIFNRIFVEIYLYILYVYFNHSLSLSGKTVRNYLVESQGDFLNSTTFSMSINLFAVIMSAAVLFVIARFAMKIDLPLLFRPDREKTAAGFVWAPQCITLNLLSGILVSIVISSLNQSGIEVPSSDFTIRSPSALSVGLQLFYVCLAGPIVEEFVYRGLVIKLLNPYGKGLAVFFSALIFGLMHGNLSQAASAFAGGLIYAAVASKYDSILPTIIMHIINNLIASIVDISDALGLPYGSEVTMAVQIVMLFIGFYGIIVLTEGLVRELKKSDAACRNSFVSRMCHVFINPVMILYFAYLVYVFIKSFVQAN